MLNFKSSLILFLIIIYSSCSYKITRYGYDVNIKTDTSFKNNVLIKNEVLMYGIDAQYLGSIKIENKVFTSNCSKNEAYNILIKDAEILNANFVNITDVAVNNFYGNCYNYTADFYKMKLDSFNLKLLNYPRDTIHYNDKKLLTFDDFKSEKMHKQDTNDLGFLYSSLFMYIKSINVWTGVAEFYATSVMFRDVSWIKKDDLYALSYFQTVFKLSQISALRLQKYLNRKKINGGRTKIITKIFNQHNKKYWNKIDSFMIATNFGKDTTEFKNLKKKIDNQYKSINLK